MVSVVLVNPHLAKPEHAACVACTSWDAAKQMRLFFYDCKVMTHVSRLCTVQMESHGEFAFKLWVDFNC